MVKKKLVCAMNKFTTVARVRYSFVCVRVRAACLRDYCFLFVCEVNLGLYD